MTAPTLPSRHLTRLVPAGFLLALLGCSERATLGPQAPDVLEPEAAIAAAAVGTNVWTTRASMPTARARLATGVVNGVLYAVGGDGFTSPVATVEAYAVGSNSWTPQAALPEARSSLSGAGTINGVLYVAGGLDASGQATTTLFAYNASTDTWTARAPMPVAGACGAGAVIDGRLYVYTNASSCSETDDHAFLRYDPGTDTWATLTLPTYLHYLPSAGASSPAGERCIAGEGTCWDSFAPRPTSGPARRTTAPVP